eukprot:CAMPEP_0114606978 /NCGR_PEP_ID=MMETSP0168-20121206/1837_1 /TAXON_ID=95228 ORGANISM="Vannella sp., Strain DIVA3 517/6/12" /NCGR_SAMPLE_ID=MMETSP0168 /ASSEMBLY_ACC=CAM_ASM_000044 /LENGTH=108 /DNA_ID=CAMNT_0001817853 /DNA_START=63 /DNA_END=389 /DNA_ORIENTATION=+
MGSVTSCMGTSSSKSSRTSFGNDSNAAANLTFFRVSLGCTAARAGGGLMEESLSSISLRSMDSSADTPMRWLVFVVFFTAGGESFLAAPVLACIGAVGAAGGLAPLAP